MEPITETIIRTDKQGNLLAVFPYLISDRAGNCTCYARIGQHSACNWEYITTETRPTTKEHAKDLLNELCQIGYNLKVIKRRNHKKYLANYLKS